MFFHDKGAGGGKRLPLLPLRELVVFPHAAVSFIVGRERSIAALNEAMRGERLIFLVTQREATTRDPAAGELHSVGTVANVVQVMRLPDATVKVLVEGVQRGRIERFVEEQGHFVVEVEEIPDPSQAGPELAAQVRQVKEAFEEYVKLNKGISPEASSAVLAVEEAGRLSDTVVRFLSLKTEQRQQLLEMGASHERLEQLLRVMQSEIDILQVERKIKTRVKKQMERSQKEYYLTEQMQAIQKELGEKDEFRSESQELEARAAALDLTAEARERVDRELKKLKMMSPMSAEAAVVRNYLEVLLAMPWGVFTDGWPRQDVLGWGKRHAAVRNFATFLRQLKSGTLPRVSFVDPGNGKDLHQDEHPPHNVQDGEAFARSIYEAAVASPLWPRMALIYTYDEGGGMFEHVPPPTACAATPFEADVTQLGFRVPLIVVSPYARRHYVSHEPREHTAILRFIEALYDLPALTARDANSDALLDLFDFSSPQPPAPNPPAAGVNGCATGGSDLPDEDDEDEEDEEEAPDEADNAGVGEPAPTAGVSPPHGLELAP